MDNAKHTPGPWTATSYHYSKRGTRFSRPAVQGPGGHYITTEVCTHNVSGDADKANANLIAAAPDLLEALEQARAALPAAWAAHKDGVPREVIELINAAIAKAKGQP